MSSTTGGESLVRAGARRLRPESREPQTGFQKGLDLLSRFEYASAGSARALLDGRVNDIPREFYEGLTGKDRITYLDIAQDELGLSTKPFFNIPDIGLIPDLAEDIARTIISPAGIVGTGLGWYLDPTSWLGFGMLTKGGQFGRLLKGGRTAKDFKKGGSLAREYEAFVARTGKAPVPLEITVAAQGKAGQRALVQVVTPFGKPLWTISTGQPVLDATTKLARVLRGSPQLSAAARLFGNFGVPEQTLDEWAIARARMRRDSDDILKRLVEIGKDLDDLDSVAIRDVLEAERLTRKRLVAMTALKTPPTEGKPHMASLLDQMATDAEKVLKKLDEGGEVLTQELVDEVDVLDKLMFEAAAAGGMPNTKPFRDLTAKYMRMNKHLKETNPQRKVGSASSFISETATPEGIDAALQGKGILSSKQKLKNITKEMGKRMDGVRERDPFDDSVRVLRDALDPDLRRLDMIDNLVNRIRLSAVKPATQRRVLEATDNADMIRLAREIPEGGLEAKDIVADFLTTSRFADLKPRLQSLALEFEQIYSDIWVREEARGLITSRRPAYFPHMKNADLGKLRWVANFGKRPVEVPRLPFERERKIQGTVSEINRQMGKKFFVEDLLTATALRAVASSRAVSYFDFVQSVVKQNGLNELGRPGKVKDVAKARLFVGRLNEQGRKTGELFDMYFARGRSGPIKPGDVSEKALRQAIRENVAAKSGGLAPDAFEAAKVRAAAAGKTVGPEDVKVSEAVAEAKRAMKLEESDPSLVDTLRWMSNKNGDEILVNGTPAEMDYFMALGQNPDVYILPKEVADFMNRANQFNNTPEGLVAIGNMIKSVRNVWVPWTLFIFPGYHARNSVGNVLNALYAGLRNPARYKDAFDLQRHGLRDGKVSAEWLKSKTWTDDLNNVITADQIIQELHEMGVINAGWAYTEAAELSINSVQQAIKKAGGAKKYVEALNPLDTKNNVFLKAGYEIGTLIENNARIALYLDRRLKGDTPRLGARVVRKHLFDYDEITQTERFLRTFFMPFYVWTRKNLSLQVEQLITRPGTFSSVARIQRLLEASTDPDSEILPSWMHEAFPVRVGKADDGRSRYEYFLLRNWMPAVELQSFFKPWNTTLGMLAPWFKLPLERALNYNTFTRRQLEQYDGQKGVFLFQNFRRKDIEIVKSVRFLSELDRIMGVDPSDPRFAFQPPLLERLFQFGTGLKTFAVDLDKTMTVARGQQRRIIRELQIQGSRARKRGDLQGWEDILELINGERSRELDSVWPTGITGAPVRP